MIWKIFAQDQLETLYKKLELLLDNLDVGVDTDKYYEMAEQMGYEIDPEKAPPRLQELPEEVSIAFDIYSFLPDRLDGMVGYLGKDFSMFPTLIDLYNIDSHKRTVILEILLWVNRRTIEKSQAKSKAGANTRGR